jgi:hypothetical protein
MHVSRPLALLLLIGVACARSGGVAARVGDAEITNEAVESELDAIAANPAYVRSLESEHGPLRAPSGDWQPAFVAEVLTRQIHDVFVRAEAANAGVEPDKEQLALSVELTADEVGGRAILAAFDPRYRDLLVERNAYLGALKAAALSDETPESFYRSNRDEFVRVCARHIVTESKRSAESARERIAAGASFEHVARDVSLDGGTAPKGGDLGCNKPEDLVPELQRLSLRQDVNEVGPPIATAGGWQVLEVTKRTAPPFRDVRGEVRGAMSRTAEARVGAALERRLGRSRVTVLGGHGRWDRETRKVVA